MSNKMQTIEKITMALGVLDTLSDVFTKKDYDEARPRKSTSLDWLRDEGIVVLDHTENFEIEDKSPYARYNKVKAERVVFDKNGEVICTAKEWDNFPDKVKETLTLANGGTLLVGEKEIKPTIKVCKHYYKVDRSKIESKIERCLEETLEYAETQLAKLEPKVTLYKAIIEKYAYAYED